MSRNHYNTILAVSFLVLIAFFILFRLINRSIERHLTSQLQKIKAELSQPQEQAPKQITKELKRQLKPSDLSPYQIIPHRKSDLFKNQQYWDIMTKNALQLSNITGNSETEGIFKGIAKTPDQFKNQIQQIDARIREYKRIIHDNPNDEYAKQKLQNLYMIKSTVKTLRETIVPENH